MIRALLIDDEATVRADLRAMLAVHPQIAIVGEAATVNTARTRLASPDYDLVFLDIQLIGGTGFDLVPDVRPGAKIIFVTAHNEHALRAFEVNALDYLLKPVKKDRLASSIGRVSVDSISVPAAAAPPPATADDAEPPPPATVLDLDDIVHLNTGNFARFAAVSDITAIEAQENYTLVCLADRSQLLVRRTLKAWEDILPPNEFMRVHRALIANLARVAGYQRDAKTVTLTLTGLPEPVVVSRRLWVEVSARLAERFPTA